MDPDGLDETSAPLRKQTPASGQTIDELLRLLASLKAPPTTTETSGTAPRHTSDPRPRYDRAWLAKRIDVRSSDLHKALSPSYVLGPELLVVQAAARKYLNREIHSMRLEAARAKRV